MTLQRSPHALRAALALYILSASVAAAPAQVSAAPHTPLELLQAMIANEAAAMQTKERFEYVSNERSDRTGGHVWTERVVETEQGRVRLLTAIDGKPLPPQQAEQVRDGLRAIAADPSNFVRREAAQHNDEEHERHMMEVLTRDFLFDNVRLQDGVWRMDFRPNPAASPSGIEDRVLHGMSGWMAIDARDLRLIHIEGRLLQEVTIGYGLLANFHVGSRFASDRHKVAGYWRTTSVATDIHGKAALFKSVSRNSSMVRSEFRYIDHDITVSEAVALLLAPGPQNLLAEKK